VDQSEPDAAYGGSWFAATKVSAPARPPLTGDLDVDVCIIGGGLAGLTTAREVARSGWSVALLEAGRIAAKASGRNTGFVLPGFAALEESLVKRVGFTQAADLWALSQAGVEYVRDIIRDDALPGVSPQPGWLQVSKTDNTDAFTRLVGLLGEFGAEIEAWETDRVRAVLHSERYFHAIHYPAAINIHPLNYALGLAAAAERAGVRIYEYTPALSIDAAGVRKRVDTAHARVRANHVVLCANVGGEGLVPTIAATLIPLTTYVITTAPLGARIGDAVAYGGSVSDSELADNHYRRVDGDRLLWAGRLTTREHDPRRYANALLADIKRTYPQLDGVASEYAWAGTLGRTVHGMPQIGQLSPGLWLASGFGGHGLNATALAGLLIARAMVDGDQTWKHFSAFELVWAGGRLGRATAQVYYWAMRLREAAAERRARAADAARRRAQKVQTPVAEAPITPADAHIPADSGIGSEETDSGSIHSATDSVSG
jgi:glycine/D-amino acid oxidase-like deaminating enzyme